MANEKTETFIIHVKPDGEIEAFRAKQTSKKRFDPFAPVDLIDILPAFQFGLDMQELVADGYKMGEPVIQEMHDDEQREWLQIVVELEEIEPPEPVGVEYLRSLPAGARILSPSGGFRLIIVRSGVHWVDDEDTVGWETIKRDRLLRTASAENCKQWSPE